ncbi:MAG: GldG family protein, partial [Ferruginibacter sp.]
MITIIALFAVNWLASQYHSRIDFTNEKRFTLSSPTKKVLSKLDDVVQVDVFLKGDFPSGFKKLANSTGEVLQEFKEIAGKNLQYRFISPEEDVEGTNIKWADTLAALGFYPINLTSQVKAGQQQQNIYPVAFVHYKENILPVILYQGKTKAITYPEINSAEAMMEYNFISAIDKLQQTKKPTIVYSGGNGEPMDARTYDLSENVLKLDYEFPPQINLKLIPRIPDVVDVLMIVKPTEQ